MGYFDGLFSRDKIKEGQDLTGEAAKMLSDRGIVDPRIYNENIKFKGVEKPTEDMKYSKAYVNKNKPSEVNLVKPQFNNLWSNPLNVGTLAHEQEHSLAHSGGAELNTKRNRGDVLLDNYAFLHGRKPENNKEYYKPLSTLYTRLADEKVRNHLEKHYKVSTNYIGSGAAKDMYMPHHYEELASDLGAIAKLSKKDMFADKFLQKHLFNNDPYLMEAVSSTLNVQPRMDAKDPQRLTAFPENVDRYRKLIKYAQGGMVDDASNKKLI